MRKLSLRKPSDEQLREFLEKQSSLKFSYTHVGASAKEPPAEFVVDRTRVELGSGPDTFEAARRALQNWKQFGLGWVDAWPHEAPIETGQVVAVMGRGAGLWWLNACRIVYVIDESGPISRFGFAYGTMPGHVASGEERFLIEWDRKTDQIHYDILAFSQASDWLIKLAYPIFRRRQKRFGKDSAAAMKKAVQE